MFEVPDKTELLENEVKELKTDMNSLWIMFCRLVERFTEDGKVSFKMTDLYDEPETMYYVDREDDRIHNSVTIRVRRTDSDSI